MDPSYVELHLHTAFSFLDGASQPWEMVDRAQQLGYEALAITDHDGLYGAMEFARHARNAGIAPIIGAELTLADGSHLTLLAETAAGYTNLSRLITEAHRIDEAEGRRRKAVEEPFQHSALSTQHPDAASCLPPSAALRGIGKTKHRYRDK
ncbi:MAG: PHP domain-containing protein, partial [Thermomicrobiales bacterium]